MGTTFTRAVEVAEGEAITSSQLRTLAEAFNSRLRSGVGDGTWRIFYLLHAFLRSVRYLMPEDEFWRLRQAIDPSDAEWPQALPGNPGGANPENPLARYVFGQGSTLEPEADRLAATGWTTQGAISDAEAWALGASQCGAYDPVTGAMGAPAFDAARSHFAISYGSRSPFGHAFGGFHPLPEQGPGCEDPDTGDEYPAPINYQVFFTSIAAGEDGSAFHATTSTNPNGTTKLAYAGTCAPAPGDSYDLHVAGVVQMPWAYYVRLNDGTVDVLPTDAWVEGPYEGYGELRRTPVNLQRVLHGFVREFRGSTAQRAEDGYHVENAFPFEDVLSRQYLLAPVRGVRDGNAVVPIQTVFEWRASSPPLTEGLTIRGRNRVHAIAEGFVVATVYVSAEKLDEAVTVEARLGTQLIQTMEIKPAEGGTVGLIVQWDPPATAGDISFRVATGLRLGSSGFLRIELREQVDYKPLTHDLALLLRCASAGAGEHVDGQGVDESYAREIGEQYLRQGILLNQHNTPELPEAFTAINRNGIFEAARQWSRCCRVIRRDQIRAYGVSGGKSILWVARMRVDPDRGEAFDAFEGIGPSRIPITKGQLEEGVTYIVTAGAVRYGERVYRVGDTFTAGSSDTWEDSGTVMEYNGIRAAAPRGGESNEWLMDVHLAPYHPSETSAWYAPTFADAGLIFNRCHFGSPEISNDATSLWHYGFGRRTTGTYGGVTVPETPSGYTYAPLRTSWLGRSAINTVTCVDPAPTPCTEWRKAFYRSCRIYEPPVEIESAVRDTGTNGEELLKLTFTGRLHYTPEAPTSISSDITTWSLSTIQAESFRSIENGIREYLIHARVGGHCQAGDEPPYSGSGPTGQPGNAAANTSFYVEPDDPFGTCYPTLVFTRLIPHPYEDSDDEQGPDDTPFRHDPLTQAELYLRAMCEGYVDGQTSTDYACRLGVMTVFDFTFEALCVQAFGGRWISPLSSTVRSDRGEGFGPLPNTVAYAQVFNQLVKAVNLLTDARVMLPMILEYQAGYGTSTTYISAADPDGNPLPCFGGNQIAQINAPIPEPTVTWSGTWTAGIGGSTVSAYLSGSCDGDGGWALVVERTDTLHRWSPVDPDALEALPEGIRDYLKDNPVVLFLFDDRTIPLVGTLVTDINASSGCCQAADEPCPGKWATSGGQWWNFDTAPDASYPCEINLGEVQAPPLASGQLAYARTSDGTVCNPGPSNTRTPTAISDSTAVIRVPVEDWSPAT